MAVNLCIRWCMPNFAFHPPLVGIIASSESPSGALRRPIGDSSRSSFSAHVYAVQAFSKAPVTLLALWRILSHDFDRYQ